MMPQSIIILEEQTRMKKIKFLVIPFFVLIFTSIQCYADYYYSRQNGNWSSPSTWNIYVPGIGLVPATTSPLGTDTAYVSHNVITGGGQFINFLTLHPNGKVGGINILRELTMNYNSEVLGVLSMGDKFSGPSTKINALGASGQNPPRIHGLRVHSDSTIISGYAELYGELYVYPDAKLFMGGGLMCYNDIKVDGILTGGSYSLLVRKNSDITVNGIISCASFYIDSCDVEISGIGKFSTYILAGNQYPASISFTSDMEFAKGLNIHRCGFHLNNHTLRLSGSYFQYDSTCTVLGPGEVHTSGETAILGQNQVFPFPLVVENGRTYPGYPMTFANSIFVNPNATFQISVAITVNGTFTNNGNLFFFLNGVGLNMHNTFYNNRRVTGLGIFNFYDANFFNNDSMNIETFNFFGNTFNNIGIFNATNLNFYGSSFTENGSKESSSNSNSSGPQTIYGSGSISNSTLIIKNGANVTLGSDHKMKAVNINSGGLFDISNKHLYLNGTNPITNNGSFNTSGSTIEYNGITLQDISTTNVSYFNLNVNNPSGVYVSSDFNLNDTLRLISGDFNIPGGRIVTFLPSAYLIETLGNTIVGNGNITTTLNLNSPYQYDVNGLGIYISSTSNLGSTVIKRSGTSFTNVFIIDGVYTPSIKRSFEINPTNNIGLNATLKFKYDDSELNGRPEGSLQLFRSTNAGGPWTLRGGTINTSTNEISLSGIDAFSRWTAGSAYSTSTIKVIPEGLYNSATNKLNRKDTVRIYLRNAVSPFSIVDSAKSVIDSITFNGSYTFTNAPSGNYYIQTKHRNSIETWSKSGGETYNLGSAFSYDFTALSSQAYGSNMIQVDATPIRFAIYSGDIDQDGIIDASDVSIVDNDASNSLSGYVASDLNRDDFIDASDISIVENNSYRGVIAITP